MRIATLIVLVVVMAMVIDDGLCWRRRSGRRRSWIRKAKEVAKSAAKSAAINAAAKAVITGIGRKRRALEEQEQLPDELLLSGSDELDGVADLPAKAAATTTQHKTEASREKCAECVEIKPIKPEDEGAVKNATLANNDFVMIVRFIEENKSAAKMEAKIKFEVTQVVKSLVKVGGTFTINAKLATCPCLTSLDPGHYVVTGSMDSEKRLVLSSVLLEFEE